MIRVTARIQTSRLTACQDEFRRNGYRFELYQHTPEYATLRVRVDYHAAAVQRAKAIFAGYSADQVRVTDEADRPVSECGQCHNYRSDYDSRETPEGEPICGNCYYNNYITCYGTGVVVPRRDSWIGPDDNYYSTAFGPENFERCSHCQGQRLSCNFIESRRRGRVCDYCDDTPRDECYHGRQRNFSSDNTFGSSRSYGIELESNRGVGSRDYAFDGKYDGSIRGLEYVSHKLRGDEGLAEIRGFLEDSRDLRSNRACGYHLHMNVRDMSDSQKYATFIAYIATQEEWHEMVDQTRNNNGYCHRLRRADLMDAITAWREGRSFNDYACNRDRYFWINVQAISRHNTFENRLHHGTFDFNEVAGWIITNLRFTKKVKHLSVFDDSAQVTEESIAAFRTEAKRALRRAKRFANQYLGIQQIVAQPA